MLGFEKKEVNQEEKIRKENMKLVKEQTAFDQITGDDATFIEQKRETADLTRWQQDLSPDLEQLKHDLLRETEISKGRWEPEIDYTRPLVDVKGEYLTNDGHQLYAPAKSLMNSQGVYTILTLVKRFLNKNFMMPNLSEDIIQRMMRDLVMRTCMTLGSNVEAYEIDDINLPIILKMIKDPVEATLYRAWNDGERRHLNTINKRVEALTITDRAEPKRGFMGVLSGR